MKKAYVSNFINPQGNTVKNQFLIQTEKGLFFQSYETVIAFKDLAGNVTLNDQYEYSNTTSKYLGYFLKSNMKDIRKAVAAGTYKQENLNK